MFAYKQLDADFRIVRALNRIINNFRSHHNASGAINERHCKTQRKYFIHETKINFNRMPKNK